MLMVSELYIYPIKSLGGIAVSSALVTDRGFEYDRRWMLIDEHNNFLTQRKHPLMAVLQVFLTSNGLRVQHKSSGSQIEVPLLPQTTDTTIAGIWDDQCLVQFVGPAADDWFSAMLSTRCRLVYMPDSTHRKVDAAYAINHDITSLSDGYPVLIIGQASLNDLNSRLAEPLPIDRFRPNIVFTGGLPYEEDILQQFTISDINFYGVKRCARCVVTTTNQQTGSRGKEPLSTLATYRSIKNKIYFGQNLLIKGSGAVRVGDAIVRS